MITTRETEEDKSKKQRKRRKFPRIDTSLLLKYRVIEPKRISRQSSSIAKNISEDGFLLELPTFLPKDTFLQLKIALPNSKKDEPVRLLAKVVWSKPLPSEKRYNTGVCLVKAGGKDKRRFLEYLSLEKKKG